MKTRFGFHHQLGFGMIAAVIGMSPVRLGAQDARPPAPVTVQGPVNVQGVVEVINDVLRQPYVRSGSASSDAPIVTFDIPDGKRLIIETVAFQASRPAADANRMFFEPLINGERHLVPLPIQFTSVEGAVSYLISMIPMTARIDSATNSTTELRFRRGSGAVGSLNVTVFGYLVDI
jgi:hypothetical protein